jgi:hypothetical protein
MSLKFNIDRPRISDDEIKKQQNFKALVDKFKQQSLKQAQGDESWWKNKRIRYTTVIAGITVVCTVTYLSLFNSKTQKTKTNETLTTQNIQKVPAKKFIDPPSKKLSTPYSIYKVDNNKGGNITHASSSKLKIPKSTFVDKAGKDIVGDVTIEYKEFHDIGDIITGGIPMAYDSSGHKYNLESAGMFEIKGSQNGIPVFIKPDKSIEIELASINNETRFNQYYLDTVAKNWQYLKRDVIAKTEKEIFHANNKSVVVSNKKLETLSNEIEKVIPEKIQTVSKTYERKIETLPKIIEPTKPVKLTDGRPSFKLDGSYDEFPELSVFNNVVFEVGKENKNYSKELHEITWSDVKIGHGPLKGKNYILNLTYRNRSEKLIVYPVLSGNDFEKAQKVYEQKLENYEDLVEKREAEEKRLLAEMQAKQAVYLAEQKKKQEEYEKEKALLRAKFDQTEQNELSSNFNGMSLQVKARRIFNINRFGVFNSDCPQPALEGTSINPIFISNEKEKIIQPDFIYLVDHVKKTVFNITREQGLKINYNDNSVYSICLFEKNKMYLCNKSTFKQTTENQSNKFVVTPLPDDADNLVDFKKILEI